MGRASTKENKNIYQKTREALRLTRETAGELLETIPPERIEKIENERSLPYPDEVLAMAEKYRQPNLCNYYCANQCPIGQQYVPEIQIKDLSQIVLEMLASLNSVSKQKDRLIEITADGKISGDELEDFIFIQEELEQMGLRVPEDVQVIGYDGLRWMNTGQPFVSSIYQDTGIIAKTSVDCLMRLLNGEAVEDILDLPIVFQDGGTTLPLPETDIKEKQGIMLPILEGEDRR